MATVRHFSTAELAGMQATQDSAMQDTCVILAYTSAVDGYGNPQARYEVGEALICGLEHVSPREMQASGRVPIVSAKLRLPIGTTVDPRDVVMVTYRYDAAVITQYFDVVGIHRRGPSGLYLDLETVVAPPVTFTTSVWDDFNRASLGSNWTTKIFPTYDALTIISNQAGGAGGVGIIYSGWWNQRVMGANVLVATRVRAIAESCAIHLYARLSDPGIATASAYLLIHTYLNSWTLARYVSGTYKSLASGVHALVADEFMGLQCSGSTLSCRWSPDGVIWTTLFSCTDSSLSASGYVGLAASNTARVDDFSGLEL